MAPAAASRNSSGMPRKRTSPQDTALLEPTADETHPWRTDEFLETYVCWREECELLALAYDAWKSATITDLALAFAAYRAALDREHQAATRLAAASERLGEDPIG
jgi:hypothetical protein